MCLAALVIITSGIGLQDKFLIVPAYAQSSSARAGSGDLGTYADGPQTLQQKAKVKEYSAGVYMMNIGKIDTQTGSYDLDFYFWISSTGENFTANKPRFDFMNGKVTIDPSRIEPNYYEARVKGTFMKNMDFHNYPFDRQNLTIEVEGFETIDKMVFVPDNNSSGFDSLINIPGWNVGHGKSSVLVHQYPDSSYSRYVYSFTIERSPLSSFLKTILPVVIITTIAMLAFWMSPTNFTSRIGLAASTLLAAVAAHLNASSQLPPIGYLTLMDKVMIVAYSLFLYNLISLVIQMRLVDNKRENDAIKINSKMRRSMPIIIGAVFLALVAI